MLFGNCLVLLINNMTAQQSLSVEKYATFCPPLNDVASVLQEGLAKNFADVKVSIVDCPDLTQKPFSLTASGLCGNPRLADIGGVPYLVPLVQKDKKYDLRKITGLVDLPEALTIGAGCGPCHIVGRNSEMMVNLKTGSDSAVTSGSYTCEVTPENGGYLLKKTDATEFCCLMNVFLSDGKPGKVLEVRAAKRTGPDNLMDCLRQTLQKHYGDKPVGLGGTFLFEKGKAKIHVMPDFSTTPLKSDDDVNKWLKFYDMDAPLTCVGYLISSDPGLDLRMEHFHCFSDHGDGGHFHYDVTPEDASYRGYFNVSECIYRVDRPKVTHQIGRDVNVKE